MQRVLHYRIYGLPEHRLERLHEQFDALARARTLALRPTLDRELLLARSVRDGVLPPRARSEGGDLIAAGFVKMAGDETDALIITIFLRDLSAEYGIRACSEDEDHPLAKLRMPRLRQRPAADRALTLEDVLAKRPVIKKVEGERILFYPPTFRLHSQSPPSPEWAYALYGIRAYAPTLARGRARGAQDPARLRPSWPLRPPPPAGPHLRRRHAARLSGVAEARRHDHVRGRAWSGRAQRPIQAIRRRDGAIEAWPLTRSTCADTGRARDSVATSTRGRSGPTT